MISNTHYGTMNTGHVDFMSSSSFTIKMSNSIRWDGTMYYGIGDIPATWTTWDSTLITSTQGSDGLYHIYLRGENNTTFSYSSTGYVSHIVITGSNVRVLGSVANLFDYTKVCSNSTITPARACCYQMFYGCTALTYIDPKFFSYKNLDISAAPNCYSQMFSSCTNLVNAPALPANAAVSYGYNRMFQDCTGLTSAPALPATTLAESCYSYMFSGCTSLTTAPALNATSLAESCYEYMFNNCTGLTAAPTLNAKSLASRCYWGMFQGCKALTTAPALPATELKASCYCRMFLNCTGITTSPALPATILAESCYSQMFNDCTGLITASTISATTCAYRCCYYMFGGCTNLKTVQATLPAMTLAEGCYYDMFLNCKALITAPALPATTLANGCYYAMFQGCTSLTTIPSLPATTIADYCYNNMFRSCSQLNFSKTKTSTSINRFRCPSYGVFAEANNWNSNMFYDTAGETTCDRHVTYFVNATVNPEVEIDYLRVTFDNAATKIYKYTTGTPTGSDVKYSLDKTTWYDLSTTSIAPGAGVTWYFKGNNPSGFSSSTNAYTSIKILYGAATLAGDVMSLIDNGECNTLTIPNTYCFYGLFAGDSITDASNFSLPATTLTEYCYGGRTSIAAGDGILSNCTNLVYGPKVLPAKTAPDHCYDKMFSSCTSLKQTPVIEATSFGSCSCRSMFYECASLTTASPIKATSVGSYCFSYCFSSCSSLTTLPALATLSLPGYAYSSMFNRCVNIKLSTTQTGEYQNAYRIPTSGTGTVASHDLDNMFTNTGGTFTGAPTINTTYYTSNTIV